MNKKFSSILVSCFMASVIPFVNASESNIRPEIVEYLKEFCSTNNRNYAEMFGAVSYACDCKASDVDSNKASLYKNYKCLLKLFKSCPFHSCFDLVTKIDEKYKNYFKSPPKNVKLLQTPNAPRFEDGYEYRKHMEKLGRPLNE